MYDQKRILVVEDIVTTADYLQRKFTREFPCATIDMAYDASEADRRLERADRNGPYDFIVLDIKLPRGGSTKEQVYAFNLSSVQRLCATSGDTTVIFTSAYLDDPAIAAFRNECSIRRPGQEGRALAHQIFIEKDDQDSSWVAELLDYMRTAIHSQRIEERLRQTFTSPREPVLSGVYRLAAKSFSPEPRDATHMIADLASDIARHWMFLDETTQRRVGEHFKVEIQGDKVRIS